MLYCNNCHRITAGEPAFCNFCGRSYNLKLCPHRHPNPRIAEICSTCGSRDLSTPHPRVSLWLAPLLILLSAVPGLLLLLLSVLLLIGLFTALVSNQQLLFQVMLLGLVIAFLWWLYMQLPGFLRKALTKMFSRKERNRNEH
jgi:RNA polymerase subunit RPABC4/transcription elongation factor Spt4